MPIAWTQGIDDPSYPARNWCSAGQVGTKMYMFGGNEGQTLNRIYDMATGIWSSGAALTSGVIQPANQAPAVGTKLYVAGGSLMRVYDTVGNSWANYGGGNSTTFPASFAVGTNIYVAGGWSSQTQFNKFNTLTNAWSALTALPFANCYMATFVMIDSDNIRLFCTTYGTGNASNDWGLRNNYNYNISGSTWDLVSYTPIPAEPDNPYIAGASGAKIVGTGLAGVVRIGNNVHVIGGAYTTTIGYYHNRIYNITADTWLDGLAKPSSMVGGAMGFYQDKLYTYNYGMEVYQFLDVPAAPINGEALGRNNKNILSWEDPAWVSGITYRIYWSYVPGVTTGDTRIETGSADLTYEHTGLVNFITVYYRVAAYNVAYDYESSLSNEFSGTPKVGGSDGRIIW